ncbi:hypothetical protein DFJ63DRAFT_221968 [Scheffersomyces coipomensis]|uniref:uncharacterized protein n=1 Tax=Scheffersomyces coipomensis TaxID=1788519 RepID=UPI00315D9910
MDDVDNQSFSLILRVIDNDLSKSNDSHFEVLINTTLSDTIAEVKAKVRSGYIILDYQQEEVAYKGFILSDSQTLGEVLQGDDLSQELQEENFIVYINNKPDFESGKDDIISLDDESSIEYQFEVSNDSDKTTMVLSDQDCIIVENDVQSYVLISKSGTSKLNHTLSTLKNTKIEKISVQYVNKDVSDTNNYEEAIPPANDPNPNPHPNADNEHENDVPVQEILMNIGRQLGNTIQEVVTLLFKGFVILQILGIGIPQYFLTNWYQYLAYAILAHLLYSILIAPNGIQRLNLQNNNNQFIAIPREFYNVVKRNLDEIRDELIRTSVRRTRDYQYVLEHKNIIIDNMENICKDILMYFLSIVPSFQEKLEIEINSWKNTEIEELELKVKLYADLINSLVEGYNSIFIPDFEYEQDISLRRLETDMNKINHLIELEDDGGKIHKKEEKFKYLIEFYRLLQQVYPILNKAVINKVPYKDGKRKTDIKDEKETHVENVEEPVIDESIDEKKVDNVIDEQEDEVIEVIFETEGESSSSGVQILHEVDNEDIVS